MVNRVLRPNASSSAWLGVQFQPVFEYDANARAEFIWVRVLHKIRSHAQLICALDVRRFIRTGEHDNRHIAKGGLAANPFQNFVAVAAWQFDVQKDQVRQWMAAAIPVVRDAGQIIDCGITVRNDAHTMRNPRGIACGLQKKYVVRVVLDEQHSL